MKKLFLISTISLIATNTAHAIPWWEQETVCRISPTDCYMAMGAGFDAEMWDASSNCWGMKIICGDALNPRSTSNKTIDRASILRGTGISSDFDINLMSQYDDCFGRRKTIDNDTMASVNNKYVKVWCPGILSNPSEELDNGEITFGTEPSCSTLARNGIVGILNNKCYGKYYDTNKYYIDCGDAPLPRLIVLNGADYTSASNGITDKKAANEKFNLMAENAASMRKKHNIE